MNPSPGTEMLIYACASGLAWLGVCEHLCVPGGDGGALGMGLEAEAGCGQGSVLPQFRPGKTRSPLPLRLVWCTQGSFLQQKACGTQT